MSLQCELSGEAIIPAESGMMSANTNNSNNTTNGSTSSSHPTYVVTPSGHVCRKDLLLQALRDNGGYDPFDLQRPLREDELIVLQQSQSSIARFVPPSTSSNSSSGITATLQQLQQQYDAILLELYDNKKILHQTQEELSLALYQNDAATRVIARLRMEYDQIAVPSASATLTTTATTAATIQPQQQPQNVVSTNGPVVQEASQKQERDVDNDETPPILTKKMKLSADGDSIPVNHIPEADHDCMIQTWSILNASRKSKQKEALIGANALNWTDISSEKFKIHIIDTDIKGPTIRDDDLDLSTNYTLFLQRYDSASNSATKDDHDMMVQIVSAESLNETTESFYEMNAHALNYKNVRKNSKSHKKYVTQPLNHHDSPQTSQMVDIDNGFTGSSCCLLDVAVVVSSLSWCTSKLEVILDTDNKSNVTIMAMLVKISDGKNKYHLMLYECHPGYGQYEQWMVGQYILPELIFDVEGEKEIVFVDLRLHPDGQHIILTTQNQNIFLFRYVSNLDDYSYEESKVRISIIAQFTMNNNSNNTDPKKVPENSDGYSAATLHPDGLIYVTALSLSGNILLWDLKSQQMAGTLVYPTVVSSESTTTTITPQQQRREVSAMQFSNNGYHLAVAYQESGLIHIWDLRKQSILVTLNGADDKDRIEEVMAVQFDDSGKYLAYSGNNKINDSTDLVVAVTTIKTWDRTATFRTSNMEVTKNGLLWDKKLKFIAVSAKQKDSNNVMMPKVAIFDLV